MQFFYTEDFLHYIICFPINLHNYSATLLWLVKVSYITLTIPVTTLGHAHFRHNFGLNIDLPNEKKNKDYFVNRLQCE